MSRRAYRIFCMVLLVTLVGGLMGCSKPPTPPPSATVAPTAPSKVQATATPGATAAPKATATPKATTTPLPPQPPRLLSRSPERGEEQALDQPILLRFDQEMDPASLEKAFRIEPVVRGKFSWQDPRTVRFIPEEGKWQRDTEYRVTVDTAAQSARKLGLARPVEFRFRTVGYLQVTDVLPLAESTDVDANTVIRVAFNRPVVPLTGVQEQAKLPQPLEFTPPIQGKGSWINTSLYTFEPSGLLLPGTKYTVRVRAGLQDTTGGVLAEDYVWSFTTALPRVVKTYPEDKARHVAPTTAITITFNQPMDHQQTQARFSLTRDRLSIPGVFSWKDNSLVFKPTQPLELGAQYQARLAEGAAAATGQAVIPQAYTWQFTVVSAPAVVATRPKEGEGNWPVGDGLIITFSSPISQDTFLKGFSITPTAKLYDWWERDKTVLHLAGSLKPSTWYTVTFSTEIRGIYGHPLQAPVTLHFRTRPYDPWVGFNTPNPYSSYNAYAETTVSVQYRNVSRVDLALYAVAPEEMVKLIGKDFWARWQKYAPQADSLLKRWSLPTQAPLNATRTLSQTLALAAGQKLTPGFYYLQASAPETKNVARQLLIVSDTNLTLKSTQTEALVWATDLREGQPVAGVQVAIYNAEGQRVAGGTTNGDGLLKAAVPEQEPWQPLIVLAKRGAGYALVSRHWSDGLEPWSFNLSGSPSLEQFRAYLYTDRRIYRPGQTVYFKGILRLDDDGRYSLPPQGGEVLLVLRDGEWREIWHQKVALNTLGTFAGEIALGEDAALGYYSLQATYDEYAFSADFQVAAYRKPEFQVQVNLDQEDYIHGDTIVAAAEATYFFGGPVANASVQWRVLRQDYYFDRWQGKGYYSFANYDETYGYGPASSWGELLTEGEGKTDAQGRFVVEIPANLAEFTQSQTYTIEFSVVDVNNQEVSARRAAVVHKGLFYIGLAPLSYVGVAGQEQAVRVITVDTHGITRTQQALTITFYRHEWYSVQEKADDGRYYWTSKVRDTAVHTTTVKTDDLGQAIARFTPPEGGMFKILAVGLDERENKVQSAAFLWVGGAGFIPWRQANNDRIDLVADKKSYRPGETAQILIPSPYQGRTMALLTIERGHILEHRVIELATNSERLSLPILPEYAPNVYVSVVIIKGMDRANPVPSFKLGYVILEVSTEQQELTIKVTPDRATPYKPRDEVTYSLEVLDHRGRGVEAEVSLQLVDLAVESLVGGGQRDIVQEFYRQRPLGVWTAATLAIAVERYQQQQVAEAKGGGGGAEAAGILRQEFPDTAFWAPAVRTDAAGKARVTVKLPDNLTTWRLTAQGVTAQTQVGKATSDIVSTLDVMVRPVVPRFLVIGDKPILGAVVHNNTGQDLEMTVKLVAEGVTVANGEQKVTVAAHGREALSWPAAVGAAERAVLRFNVSAGQYSDAIQLTLPVYHPSSPETVGTAGQVEEQIIELVRLPEAVDRSLGELTVNLEPSLAAGMRGGLEYLETYPYGCIEQTVSRFLPNVVTYGALQKLGIANAELEAKLPEQVGIGLQRIYALQNPDGGWGWWAREDSSPLLSAYVVLGLVEAQKADFSVDQQVLERGIAYLYGWLEQFAASARSQRQLRDIQAVVLYTLAEAGRGDLGRTVALVDGKGEMSLYAKAYLAMALHLTNSQDTARLKTLVNALANAAILSATGAHWEEAQRDPWAMNTDTRTTAIILRALVRLQPESSLLPNVVRWLMTARQSGRWETTQENVWSILALTDYMVLTGELQGNYHYLLRINGLERAEGDVTSENVGRAVRAQVPVGELLAGDNDVILDKTGPGTLYYSIFLRYFLPVEQMGALNRGIIVDRQYYLAGDLKTPITQAKVNDVVVVKLTMIAPNDLYFLVLEDPLPAGGEAIDTSLQTTSATAQRPELTKELPEQERGWWDWHWHWATHTELRDEKVVLFASNLPRGTYEYIYSFRCTTPGEFRVLPALAYEMYFADVFGRSAGALFTIAAGR